MIPFETGLRWTDEGSQRYRLGFPLCRNPRPGSGRSCGRHLLLVVARAGGTPGPDHFRVSPKVSGIRDDSFPPCRPAETGSGLSGEFHDRSLVVVVVADYRSESLRLSPTRVLIP